MTPSRNLGDFAHGSPIFRATSKSASVNAPTSSAAELTDSPWTTGSKQNQKFAERRSRIPSRKRLRNAHNPHAYCD
jgi:hypothetical protein